MPDLHNNSPVVGMSTFDETIGDFRPAEASASDRRYVEYFLKLAKRGRRKGCSSGERRAAALAKEIARSAPGLDGQAVSGLIDFVRLAVAYPTTARDMMTTIHAR